MPYKNPEERRLKQKLYKKNKRDDKMPCLPSFVKPNTHTYTLLHRDGSPTIFTVTVPIKYIKNTILFFEVK